MIADQALQVCIEIGNLQFHRGQLFGGMIELQGVNFYPPTLDTHIPECMSARKFLLVRFRGLN